MNNQFITKDENILWILLIFSFLMKLLFFVYYIEIKFVDDAYITARYALNLISSGQFVYNYDEFIFGVTAPLYALILSIIYFLFGSHWELALFILNLFIWNTAGLVMYQFLYNNGLKRFSVLPMVIVFLFYPSFVDNQYLGMETSLFVFLIILIIRSIQLNKIFLSAFSLGLIMITRPEGFVFVPAALSMYWMKYGHSKFLILLSRPTLWIYVLLPVITWYSFSYFYYGNVVPQSMIAKSAWNSDHYQSLVNFTYLIKMFPRLTFFPFIDSLPLVAKLFLTFITICLVLIAIISNVSSGDWLSRGSLFFYLIYMGFYLIGRGATEASWYSIPPSVALLISLYPFLKIFEQYLKKYIILFFLFVICFSSSIYVSIERAKLLNFYFDTYGQLALHLNSLQENKFNVTQKQILIGEIGVFGYLSKHYIIDIAALVSPFILKLKNSGLSLIGIIKSSNADYFVIDEKSILINHYPSVGPIYSSLNEREWFYKNCTMVAQQGSKIIYQVLKNDN